MRASSPSAGLEKSTATSFLPARFVLDTSLYGISKAGRFPTLKESSALPNSALPQFQPRSACSRLSRLMEYHILNSFATRSKS